MGPTVVDDGAVEICHGAPFDEDAYLFDELDARHAFDSLTSPICFFGHTHFAITFRLAGDLLEIVPTNGGPLVLEADSRYLINPGSVGQPRDGDARAAYAIFRTDRREVDLIRLEYPLEITQKKMLDAGLPEPLARRLGVGR